MLGISYHTLQAYLHFAAADMPAEATTAPVPDRPVKASEAFGSA
jgi:hypothetical protein